MKKQLQNLKQEFSNFPTRKQEYVIKDKKYIEFVMEDGNVKNLGRLLKDNVIYFNKFISPLDETLNYNSVDNKKILKKGEVVILDSDHIYRKEDYEKIYAKRRTLK